MMRPARPPPSLQDMTGDEQAVALDWFELYAQDLPGPVDAELRAISAAVFKKFKRARLGALFKVAQGAVEETIRAALQSISNAAPDSITCDEAAGWREAIEVQAGFTFAEANVPASAFLVQSILPQIEPRLSKAESMIAAGTSTISMDLLAAGPIPNSPLHESCFSVFTNDYAHNPVSEPQLSLFTDRIVCQFGSKHLKTNLGAPLLQKIARQVRRRVIIPKYGKTLGVDRDVQTMVYDKTNNRKAVRPLHQTHFLCTQLINLTTLSSIPPLMCAENLCHPPVYQRG